MAETPKLRYEGDSKANHGSVQLLGREAMESRIVEAGAVARSCPDKTCCSSQGIILESRRSSDLSSLGLPAEVLEFNQ